MLPSDLDTRVGVLESRLEQMCHFISRIFSISYMEEIKSLQQRIEQLEANFRKNMDEIKRKSDDKIEQEIAELDLKFEQRVEETKKDNDFQIHRKFVDLNQSLGQRIRMTQKKCKEEVKRNFDKLETRLKKIEEIVDEERMKNLAYELFIVNIKGSIASFRIRYSSIRQFAADYLSGSSLIMKQHREVSLKECFYNCDQITNIQFPSSFNTSNVTDMNSIFYNCCRLVSLNLSTFNTSSVVNMSYMFGQCGSLTSIDLSTFNTSNVTTMYCMFYNCSSLTSLDLSTFNTLKVTDMGYMFYGCNSLTSLDLSTFNTSNVGPDGIWSGCTNMFEGCSRLNKVYVKDERIKSKLPIGVQLRISR